MARKPIALLLAMTAWAALGAPLFSIEVPHGHRTHERALSGPTGHEAMPAHACCPGLTNSAVAVPLVELLAANPPCSEQHRCCFSQGPQSLPLQTRACDDESRKEFVATAQVVGVSFGPPLGIPAKSATASPPPGLLSTVLRI